MGFECGFERVNRCKDITPEEYIITNRYNNYISNDWAKDNYKTFDEYNAACYLFLSKDEDKSHIEINEDYSKFYLNPINRSTDIENWCSIGRYIDEFVVDNLEQIDQSDYYVVTEEFIDKAIIWVNEALEECKLIPATVIKAWRVNEETGDEIMNLCDGLITEDEDGNNRLIDLEFENIWIESKGYDDDKRVALENFRNALYTMKQIDIDKEFILYWRSY